MDQNFHMVRILHAPRARSTQTEGRMSLSILRDTMKEASFAGHDISLTSRCCDESFFVGKERPAGASHNQFTVYHLLI